MDWKLETKIVEKTSYHGWLGVLEVPSIMMPLIPYSDLNYLQFNLAAEDIKLDGSLGSTINNAASNSS